MQWTLPETDPYHDRIEALWDKLSVSGQLSGLFTQTEAALPPDKRELMPEVLFGAMKSWLKEIAGDGHTIQDFTASEIAEQVADKLADSAAAVNPEKGRRWKRDDRPRGGNGRF